MMGGSSTICKGWLDGVGVCPGEVGCCLCSEDGVMDVLLVECYCLSEYYGRGYGEWRVLSTRLQLFLKVH